MKDWARSRTEQRMGLALARTGTAGDSARGLSIRVDVPQLADRAGVDRGGGFGRTTLLGDLTERYRSDFTIADRKTLIDQAILVLDNFYVHRDLKWTRHAIDGGHALRGLRRRCEDLDDLAFHSSVSAIFKSLRDIHTVYVLPRPYQRLVAFLPFVMGVCRDGPADDDRFSERFLVTQLLEGFTAEHFRPGAEIVTWNGQPVGQAVRDAGETECAANPAAGLALGVRLMTVRWLGTSARPSADWVTLGYLDARSDYREIRLSWRVLELEDESDPILLPIQVLWKLEQKRGDPLSQSAIDSLDQRGVVERRAMHRMYAESSDQPAAERRGGGAVAELVATMPARADGLIESQVWQAEANGRPVRFRQIRIRGFNTTDPDVFVAAFRAAVEETEEDFLLIDIRSNPGGDLIAAECILQFLSPQPVVPLQFQFRATRTVERLVTGDGAGPPPELAEWADRVTDSVANGQQYSREGSITPERPANSVGRIYFGTVGLLFDAVTYSSGDIFAAQFADLDIGPVIGTDPNTGGGGGNMVFHGRLVDVAPETDSLGLKRLPHGARIHFALRRCRRGGRNREELIEEAGVKADHHLPLSSDDLLHGEGNLMARVAGVLEAHRRTLFDPTVRYDGDTAVIEIAVDPDPRGKPLSFFLTLDNRPHLSRDTTDGRVSFELPLLDRLQFVSVAMHRVLPYTTDWLDAKPVTVWKADIEPRGSHAA